MKKANKKQTFQVGDLVLFRTTRELFNVQHLQGIINRIDGSSFRIWTVDTGEAFDVNAADIIGIVPFSDDIPEPIA